LLFAISRRLGQNPTRLWVNGGRWGRGLKPSFTRYEALGDNELTARRSFYGRQPQGSRRLVACIIARNGERRNSLGRAGRR
jgi:hypothetical protein